MGITGSSDLTRTNYNFYKETFPIIYWLSIINKVYTQNIHKIAKCWHPKMSKRFKCLGLSKQKLYIGHQNGVLAEYSYYGITETLAINTGRKRKGSFWLKTVPP